MNTGTRIVNRRLPGITLLACMAILPGVSLVAHGEQPVAIGPYVQNVGTQNATICWATVSGQVTLTPSVNTDSCFREYQMHSILLRGLKPGMPYTYRVPGTTDDAGKCTFTTFRSGEHPFSFCVISDTQNRGNAAHQSMVARMIAEKPDMLFNVGDLVADGRSIGDWEEFFRVEGALLRSVPCYAVLGNHERDASLYFQFFSLPGNERYYSFDRGAAHFVVLDSPGHSLPEDNQSLTKAGRDRFDQQNKRYAQEQVQWLKEDLAGHPEAKYIFAFFHFPIYSMNRSRRAATDLYRAQFGTVFQDHHVTAVFNGHDHHYHREVAGGVHFVDGGAAGGMARPLDPPIPPETVKSASVPTLSRVEVGPDRAKVRVVNVAGKVVDEFELSPRPEVATKAK